jgi:hypothetical protein
MERQLHIGYIQFRYLRGKAKEEIFRSILEVEFAPKTY